MPRLRCLWDLEDDPDGNIIHIAEHGLSKQDVEDVFLDVYGEERSRSSNHPIAFGRTRSGDFIAVVYERLRTIWFIP